MILGPIKSGKILEKGGEKNLENERMWVRWKRLSSSGSRKTKYKKNHVAAKKLKHEESTSGSHQI